jgi:hypothetical protein
MMNSKQLLFHSSFRLHPFFFILSILSIPVNFFSFCKLSGGRLKYPTANLKAEAPEGEPDHEGHSCA